MAGETRRQRLESRLGQLKTARSSWEPGWRDIGEQLVPYRLQLHRGTQRPSGGRRDSGIFNSRPQLALRTLAAGMMAGITSPARDWFRLTTSDPALADSKPVRVYLDACHERISGALHGSNFYKALASGLYPDLCAIGTGAMFFDEGPGGKLRFRSIPVGEYWLEVNHEGVVDTFFHERAWTVRQLVSRFGLHRVSARARQAHDDGKLDTLATVVHAVVPNDAQQPHTITPKRAAFPFASLWWERGDERPDQFLEQSGYSEFPVLAPRWAALTTDAYGRGPGWDVLGDCRMLQHHEQRRLQLIDKLTNPPLRAVGDIKRASLLPGDITHVPRGEGATVEPIIEIPPQALAVIADQIALVESRISEGLFAHLWNMLLDDDRNQRPTATEVEAKRQEVALMLGPLLEGLNTELLEPVVERAFAIMARNLSLPPPPEELRRGGEIKIEFISIMHAMQQTGGLVGIRTLMGEIGLIAQVKPDALDKIDADVIVDELGKITGVRPDAILSNDEVASVRRMRAAQQQASEQGQAMLAATQGARNLGSVDPAKLSEVAGMLAPAAAAQGGALGPVSAG